MSLNANISENSLVSEQANVVPNKTIASRLREAHGTTGETIAVAIPGAGPVMYVDTDITEVNGNEHHVLTKTLNEIKQAVDNNIFVVIKYKVNKIVYIEYVDRVINNPDNGVFSIRTFRLDYAHDVFIYNNYTTDNPNGYPVSVDVNPVDK